MNIDQRGPLVGWLLGLIVGLSPMRSLTFLLALGVAALAGCLWLTDQAEPQARFPWYGLLAVSYAGGFLVGRILRKLMKLVLVVAGMAVAGLVFVSYLNVDTTRARQTVEEGSAWVQDQVEELSDRMLRLLPSGASVGAGLLAGGRWRRNAAGEAMDERGTDAR